MSSHIGQHRRCSRREDYNKHYTINTPTTVHAQMSCSDKRSPILLLAVSSRDDVAIYTDNSIKILCLKYKPWTDSLNSAAAVTAAFSNAAKAFAVATEDKLVTLFARREEGQWSTTARFSCPKRIFALTFTPKEEDAQVVTADRSGDIYALPVNTTSEKAEVQIIAVGDHADTAEAGSFGPVFGHYGMVTDIAVRDDDRRVLTGDRDGRIKISRWPNGWIMEGAGYYGNQGVTRVAWIGKNVLAGGWSGEVVLWEEAGGNILSKVSLGSDRGEESAKKGNHIVTSLDVRRDDGFVAVVCGEGRLELLKVVEDRLVVSHCTCGDIDVCSEVTEAFWTVDGSLIVSRRREPFIAVLSISECCDDSTKREVKISRIESKTKWQKILSIESHTMSELKFATPLQRYSVLRKREFQDNWKGKRRKESSSV